MPPVTVVSSRHRARSRPAQARRGSRGAALGGGRAGAEPPGNPWCGWNALSCVGSSSSIRTEPDEQQSALLDLRHAPHSKLHEAARNEASSAVAASAAGAWSGKVSRSSSRRRWGCHMAGPTDGEGPHDGGRVRDWPAGGSEHPATNYRGAAPKSPAGAAPRTRDVHGDRQRCVRGVVHVVLAGGRSSIWRPDPASSVPTPVSRPRSRGR